jgi:hypothetical protein
MNKKKKKYEINDKLGGDKEIGSEKAHIGGYGGDESSFSLSNMRNLLLRRHGKQAAVKKV